ncbi:TPR repeat-containing protein [Kwoniella heveanensis CBS 569]|nr:TPR repeat-containing protein [Kwoniella heveanensis CBS 569]
MSDLEWAIYRGVAPKSSTTSTSTSTSTSRVEELATQLAEADFKSILLSAEAKAIFASSPLLLEGLNVSPSFVAQSGDSASESTTSPVIRLIVAIALLHSFAQVNWTGPDLTFSPLDILPTASATSTSTEELNNASVPLLTLQGEPAYHLASQPVLLLLARRLSLSLLSSSPDSSSSSSSPSLSSSLKTLPLWLLRLHLVHIALLDEPVSLQENVFQSIEKLLADVNVAQDQDLVATIHLERGLLHHALGQDKQANQEFLTASKASGLEFELTGALGKRTKYQIAAHSQLVLLAESRKREGDGEDTAAATGQGGEGEEENNGKGAALPETLALNDDTLLEETEFTKVTRDDSASASTSRLSHIDPANQPALHPLDQSLLLSLCLSQHNNSPSSGLTGQQMMPFLVRVISHPRNWSVHTTGLLLRSRLESTRSRTVERSTLQLLALIEQMPTSDSSTTERLKYFHQLPLPSKWEMERELAKRYLSLGVTRSALEIFTRLEMWEDAVMCLQRMDRESEAETIVRDLLEGKKTESDVVSTLNKASLSEQRKNKLTAAREAKLWCLLGDLALNSEQATKDPAGARQAAIEHYEKAWQVSKHTSSRAMRSLGTIRVGLQQYEEAIICLKNALEINPLYSRAWFTLGVCLVRLERWNEAKDAFRRQVGVEDDDGEGWNNLAAVYLRLGEEGLPKGEQPPPVTFENKLLAYRALRQGLKHSYNNWRMWQNYMIISIDVGELSEAARAMTRVVEELATKDPILAVDPDVLDKLVDSVTRDDYSLLEQGEVVPTSSNEGFGLLPIVERLFDHTILPRISDSPRVWRAHARLLRWKEDWAGAQEDYLRAYRCSVVSDERVERDLEKWREAVQEIEDLVAVLSQLGPKAKAQEEAKQKDGEEPKKKKGDWKFQARGLVRTFMGRTRESFEQEKDWERLQDLLDELKRSD